MNMLALVATAGFLADEPKIQDVSARALKDVSFTARVGSANQRELAKINEDFASSYRFKSSNVWIKEPLMLRMESKVEDTQIFFIVNGTKRLVRIPRARINQKEDLSKAPGKRQTPLDFGLLVPSLFNGFFQGRFVRTESRGDFAGDHVFDLTYVPSLKDGTRQRVWVDPKMRFTTKREWYSQFGGTLMGTFVYDQPKEVGGVWVPTRVTVRNADDKVAGTTSYTGIKVNQGLSESLFKVD
jgi:outer membrane lipoprotein-sorting protein